MISRRAVLAAPVLAFSGGARAEELKLHGAEVTLVIDGDVPPELAAMIPKWVAKSADAVALYYGKFPVPVLGLGVEMRPGAGVKGGQTFPGDPPFIRMRLGGASAERHLMEADWVMVHEMIHLAFPYLDGRHNWMHEGIAVYVESIARVQAGHLPPQQIWGDFMSQMPKGLAHDGMGFDRDRSWGRTYWGGALFCLSCDIEIRKRTGNAKGLQHALRAINAERDFRREWPFLETLAVGDAATGEKVLVTAYEAVKDKDEPMDLAALWLDLGVSPGEGGAQFNDAAPLAAIRSALTAPLV